MAITKSIRHANRYRKIATTLAKHGFGYILQEVGLFHILSLPKRIMSDPNDWNTQSIGVRLRLVVEELGPAFIKLGQLVSTRKDIFPPSVVDELAKLQDHVPPFPYETAKSVIEHDLHEPLGNIYSYFDETPIAAASIGQVHKAVLHDGREVVVKISRPHIKEIIEQDIDILRDLARLLTQRFQWAQFYQLQDIVEEYVAAIRDEFDYFTEARNVEKMARTLQHFESVQVPEVYETWSSRRVLTIEFIDGYKLSELEYSTVEFDKKKLAHHLVDSFLHQVLRTGFFHSDPHPGNLLFKEGNVVAYIDFGQVGRLSKSMRRQFINYVIAMTRRNTRDVAAAIYEMADFPEDMETEIFEEDVEYLLSKYYDTPFKEIEIGAAINDVFSTSHRYGISIHKEFTMLAKAIITIESIATELDPDLSIVEIAEPYGRMLVKERLNPRDRIEDVFREGKEQFGYLRELPKEIRSALKKINDDELGVDIRMPRINILMNKLDRIGNRLSFSVILLAFSIVMVGLIVGSTFGDNNSILVQLPVIEISFIVSFFLFIWLLYAIFRSGRF